MFSEVAVSVFGIYFKLQSFVFMPIFGLTNAMVPIVAYNYGARKRDRILQWNRELFQTFSGQSGRSNTTYFNGLFYG